MLSPGLNIWWQGRSGSIYCCFPDAKLPDPWGVQQALHAKSGAQGWSGAGLDLCMQNKVSSVHGLIEVCGAQLGQYRAPSGPMYPGIRLEQYWAKSVHVGPNGGDVRQKSGMWTMNRVHRAQIHMLTL